MDVQSTHRSRRSFPNLQHLSLAPLSSRFPIEGDDYEQEPEEHERRSSHSSYIQGKSAPTTPGILSRSTSSSRQPRRKRRSAHFDSYFPPEMDVSMVKAKSAIALDTAGRRHHARTGTGSAMLSPVMSRDAERRRREQLDDEWLHRAGLAIASEARENKGQSWLVSRDSSTSLVTPTISGERPVAVDDDDLPSSPHLSRRESRVPSRIASRVASARTSRRGSLVAGSKVGFMTAMTPGSAMAAEGYFDDLDADAEPDFVEAEDDGVDEEEVSRLAKEKGLGFGGLVDRLVGFSLFNVDEDAEESVDEDAELSKEELLKKKQAELKKRREELARAAQGSADAASRNEPVNPPGQGEDGGWNDAAWLLSVASKVLY